MVSRAISLSGNIVGINLTPFVDVALVLLIMVMVAARAAAVTSAIPLQLPHESPSSPVLSTAVLSIDRTGQAYLDARPVTEMALVHALRAYPPEQLVVIADPTVPHGRVVRLIDLARVAGVARFSLQTPLMDDARR